MHCVTRLAADLMTFVMLQFMSKLVPFRFLYEKQYSNLNKCNENSAFDLFTRSLHVLNFPYTGQVARKNIVIMLLLCNFQSHFNCQCNMKF